MAGYYKTLSKTLTADDDDNVAQSQTPGSAGNLTLNGAAVSGGVATFDTARRVLITCSGNNSARTFTITGTGINGLSQSETMAGPNATTGYTARDFATVTVVSIDGASTGTVKVGTNTIGSTAPMIIDRYTNPNRLGAALILAGTVTASLEICYEDLSPLWDINSATLTWFPVPGFTSKTGNQDGQIEGPFTMLRLTVESGIVNAKAEILTPMVFGGV